LIVAHVHREKKLGQFDSLKYSSCPKNTHIEESQGPTFGLVNQFYS